MISFNDTEVKLRQITSGFFHLKFKNKIYKFFEPSASVYSEISLYTENLDNELKTAGFLTSDEELFILKERNLWSDKKQNDLETMKSDIDKLRSEKYKFKYQSKVLASIEETINRLSKSIEEMLEIRNSMFFHTIEYHKIYRTNILLISQCLRDLENKKIWNSYEDLEKNISSSDIDEIIKITTKNRITTYEIRKIARSEPWRTIWKTASKIGGNLFDRPIYDLTKSQYELCYWSNVYDSVYESSEYPGQDVIDDDEKLDSWFIEQSNRNSKGTKGSSGFTSNKKISNASEVFLVVDTLEDAAKVYEDMNTQQGRSTISKRNTYIEEKGALYDHELPDIKQSIEVEINKIAMGKK